MKFFAIVFAAIVTVAAAGPVHGNPNFEDAEVHVKAVRNIFAPSDRLNGS
jgi:hypothetical protein